MFGWGLKLKIECLHGFYKFHEDYAGEASQFMTLYGFDLAMEQDYFTFSYMKSAPRYAISGGTYLGADAVKTIEGNPWDIMRANDLVYDFTVDAVVPISTIVKNVQIAESSYYYVALGLILPGSVTEDGTRVKEYSAHYIWESAKFRYSGVKIE